MQPGKQSAAVAAEQQIVGVIWLPAVKLFCKAVWQVQSAGSLIKMLSVILQAKVIV